MVKTIVAVQAILLASTSLASADLCDQTNHADDCSALCDLHSTLTQESAQGLAWCDGSSLCSWDHILCIEGRVSQVHLGWGGASGISSNLTTWNSCGKLAHLTVLDFNGNGFTGGLPECLQELTELQQLDLGFNTLTGGVPEWIGSMTSLQSLNLNGNKLTGSLPESLGALGFLQSLSLFANSLSGSIPESVGNLKLLQSLDLEDNHFSGEVPASVGNLAFLQFFNVASNELTKLPSALGNLSALIELNAEKNQLSGSVPDWIGNLQTLQRLWLSDNQFTSWDSDSICALTSVNLIGCALRNNPLHCPIPDCAGVMGPCWTDCSDAVAV